MKILVVEDEAALASAILRALSEKDIEISIACDGLTGLEMVLKHNFDLVILDIMLPGMSGIQVCKEIRQKKIMTPILMLTALASTENIVTGLDSGADDYMVKPFKFAELEARINSLIRRSKTAIDVSDKIIIDTLEINTVSKTVTRENKAVNLTATEYKLLEYFAKNQNIMVSRIQILESVWDIDFNLGTNVVDVYVNYLRKKIDNGFPMKLIHTVFGMGYIFKVERINEHTN